MYDISFVANKMITYFWKRQGTSICHNSLGALCETSVLFCTPFRPLLSSLYKCVKLKCVFELAVYQKERENCVLWL